MSSSRSEAASHAAGEPDDPTCDVRAYGDLNDFLPREHRYRTFARPVTTGATAKDVIEAAGIPHPEIDLVMVGDRATDLGHRLTPGDRLTVYPRFATLAPPDRTRLLPPLRVDERYVLDVHLGRLARHLRLLGLDSWYRNDASDEELAGRSADEDRTLLTRDIGLLKRSIVTRGYWVRSTDPHTQVLEVLRRFPPGPDAVAFSRCLTCNGPLIDATPAEIDASMPSRSRAVFVDARRCSACGQVYWEGSHHEQLSHFVDEVRRELRGTLQQSSS